MTNRKRGREGIELNYFENEVKEVEWESVLDRNNNLYSQFHDILVTGRRNAKRK